MQIFELGDIPKIVYHGTSTQHQESLKIIDPSFGRPNLDFGQGFYTTSIKDQAIEWAKGKTYDGYKPLILTFEVDFDIIKLVKGKVFLDAGDDWAKFIIEHRTDTFPNANLDYDYVYGHLGDGKTVLLARQYLNGKITYDEFVAGLYPTSQMIFYYDQLMFRTSEACKALTKINEEVLS